MDKILIIGACGQLGTELTLRLRSLKGNEKVIASDLAFSPVGLIEDGPYEQLDILKKDDFYSILKKHQIT
ncbi:MAG: NAD-dependent epimerase, partial [Bacteroidota bacterium]